ncbi:hypothetical protein OA340_00560 [Paracoccaceae bacterium]|nr:hypothetical protein [Paracoccaceae bacterium]
MKTCLVFDIYITDTPLFFNSKKQAIEESLIVEKSSSYKKRSRLEITLYSLASYDFMDFDEIFIHYEIENLKDEKVFVEKVGSISPKAKLFQGRSSKGSDFSKIKENVLKSECDFVFYAPNNDHPIICSKETFHNYQKLLKEKINIPNLTLIYSHFQETNYATKLGSWLQVKQFPDLELIEENDNYKLVKFPSGYSAGMQIIKTNFFEEWCDLAISLNEKSIKRFDELGSFFKLPEQIAIVPKYELCRHYDTYYHTMLIGMRFPHSYISPSKVPPLFIPDGFFSKDIRIKVGFEQYDANFINFNSDADGYPFEKSVANDLVADVKEDLSGIPEFWMDKISIIKINSQRVPDENKVIKNSLSCNMPFASISKIENFLIKISNSIQKIAATLKRQLVRF